MAHPGTSSDGYVAHSGTYYKKPDLNAATKDDLLKVDQIADALAARLLAHMPFENWDAVAAVPQVGQLRLANLQKAFRIIKQQGHQDSFSPRSLARKSISKVHRMGMSDVSTSSMFRWASMWGREEADDVGAPGGTVKLQIRRAGALADLDDAPPKDVLTLNEDQLNWMMSSEGRMVLARTSHNDDEQWRALLKYLEEQGDLEELARLSSLEGWREVETLEREEEIERAHVSGSRRVAR